MYSTEVISSASIRRCFDFSSNLISICICTLPIEFMLDQIMLIEYGLPKTAGVQKLVKSSFPRKQTFSRIFHAAKPPLEAFRNVVRVLEDEADLS